MKVKKNTKTLLLSEAAKEVASKLRAGQYPNQWAAIKDIAIKRDLNWRSLSGKFSNIRKNNPDYQEYKARKITFSSAAREVISEVQKGIYLKYKDALKAVAIKYGLKFTSLRRALGEIKKTKKESTAPPENTTDLDELTFAKALSPETYEKKETNITSKSLYNTEEYIQLLRLIQKNPNANTPTIADLFLKTNTNRKKDCVAFVVYRLEKKINKIKNLTIEEKLELLTVGKRIKTREMDALHADALSDNLKEKLNLNLRGAIKPVLSYYYLLVALRSVYPKDYNVDIQKEKKERQGPDGDEQHGAQVTKKIHKEENLNEETPLNERDRVLWEYLLLRSDYIRRLEWLGVSYNEGRITRKEYQRGVDCYNHLLQDNNNQATRSLSLNQSPNHYDPSFFCAQPQQPQYPSDEALSDTAFDNIALPLSFRQG